MKFSVIIPVYNRPDEIDELLESLTLQSDKDFEVIIVEDGSTVPCLDQVKKHSGDIEIKYFYKNNEGRSIARNVGMENARGEWLVFFDSDCVIPPQYFSVLKQGLAQSGTEFYGGPDAAHESFSSVQKAINHAMTSFLTTGGIRGGKHQLEKFMPRTFNMGFTHEVYRRVGGFREMFSEDIDMSSRIKSIGITPSLIRPAYVYHKRRVDFKKFFRQVYVFGMSRITLKLLYPGSLKLVHTLPAFFLLGSVSLILLALLWKWWCIIPLGVYLVSVFIDAALSTRSLTVGLLAIPASIIQLCGYGAGFIKAWFDKCILRRKRNVSDEIMIRKGK